MPNTFYFILIKCFSVFYNPGHLSILLLCVLGKWGKAFCPHLNEYAIKSIYKSIPNNTWFEDLIIDLILWKDNNPNISLIFIDSIFFCRAYLGKFPWYYSTKKTVLHSVEVIWILLFHQHLIISFPISPSSTSPPFTSCLLSSLPFYSLSFYLPQPSFLSPSHPLLSHLLLPFPEALC